VSFSFENLGLKSVFFLLRKWT